MRWILATVALLLPLAQATHSAKPGQHAVTKRALNDTLGLTGLGTTTASGVAVGFHIDWVAGDIPETLNSRLGKNASIIGGYIHLFANNVSDAGSYAEMDEQVPHLLSMAGSTIYSPAVLPQFSLDMWTPAMTTQLAGRMQQLNAQGITVWLRFAYEMNGDWMPFGHDPTDYVNTWQAITTAVRAVAPNTLMLWAPNIKAANPPGLDGYNAYYPGAEYVDIAGLSFYWLGAGQISNGLAVGDYFSSNVQSFYSLYAGAHPIILAETSAPFHYLVPSEFSSLPQDSELPPNAAGVGGADGVNFAMQTPADGDGSTELQIKSGWFEQLASQDAVNQFPMFKAVLWFNLAKVGGTNGVLRLSTPLLPILTLHSPLTTSIARLFFLPDDFRAVKLGNDTLTAYFRGLIGDEAAYQASLIAPVSSAAPSAAASSTPGGSLGAAASSVSTSSKVAAPTASVTGAASSLGAGGALVGLMVAVLGLAVMR